MILITGILLVIAVAFAAADWRRGLFVAVPVALLQDPLRKLTPGEPVFYVMLVGVVIAVAAIAAMMSGVSLMPTRIRGWRRSLGAPFSFFIGIIGFQAINSFARFGNIFLPAIGALAYLTPFVALSLAYQSMVRSPNNYLTRFLQVYVACTFIAVSTILIEYMGYQWPILGEVGVGIRIYDLGAILSAHSGIFRSSEVAAWHAATCVCFLGILVMSRGDVTPSRALWAGALMLAIVGLGVLTGRRKFLMEIVVFASTYMSLLMYFGRGAGRFAFLSSIIGVIGAIVIIFALPDDRKQEGYNATGYDFYVERTQSVFGDVPDRFTNLGLAPIMWAYNRYGLLGAGLGVGSQGTQNFGGAQHGASEGGLGKIWLELGAPGLVIVVWLAWAFARYLWRILWLISRQSTQLSRTAYGLMSFLVANVATFTVATQVYSDIFVLLVIGTTLAGLMAMPALTERLLHQRVMRWAPSGPLVTRPS
jgi:hypothetical protein